MEASFTRWAKKQYNDQFKKLVAPAQNVINDALNTMLDYKPGVWEMWWASNHMRYTKKVSDEQMRLVHFFMVTYLKKYCRGELDDVSKEKFKANKKITGYEKEESTESTESAEKETEVKRKFRRTSAS